MSSQHSPPGRHAIALLVLLLMALLACSKVKEKLTELTVEKAADGKVDVASGGKVPDDWPAFLAPYPGAKVVVAGTSHITGTLSGSLSMETADPPEKVLAFYSNAVPGFTLKQETNINGAKTRVFMKGQQLVTVHAVRPKDVTQATVVMANF